MIAFLLACAPAPPPAAWFAAADGPAPEVTAAAGARSLVVVVGCTVRADQTAPYSGPPEVTPFLAGLAKQGVVFGDVIAAAPWTRPAVTALLTGSHALSVGMADPAPGADTRVLPEAVTTLAEHLRTRGWTPVGVSLNPNVHSRYGLNQGFHRWREPAGRWTDADGAKLPGVLALPQVDEVLAGLPADRPVFLLVVLVDAHSPFEATNADREALADPSVPAGVVDYRAALRRFDGAAEAVVTAARSRLGEDTVVALVSDHGEGLSYPAHHGRAHGRYVAPSAVEAVWITAGTGLPAGSRVAGTVSQVDVAPTLATLVGAPGFGGEGVDRSASVRSGQGMAPGVAFTDTWFQEVDRAAVYTQDRACQVDLSGTPPTDGFVDGCFDRRLDPEHTAPLDDPALQQQVLTFRALRQGVVPGGVAPADDAVDAQLRALGYQ